METLIHKIVLLLLLAGLILCQGVALRAGLGRGERDRTLFAVIVYAGIDALAIWLVATRF